MDKFKSNQQYDGVNPHADDNPIDGKYMNDLNYHHMVDRKYSL